MITYWKPTTSLVGRANAVYEEKFNMEVKVDYTETYYLNSRKIKQSHNIVYRFETNGL
jgi:hypothetical protein